MLSVLPPFAPILLPGRLAVGVATSWQLVLAVVLALALAAGLAAVTPDRYWNGSGRA